MHVCEEPSSQTKESLVVLFIQPHLDLLKVAAAVEELSRLKGLITVQPQEFQQVVPEIVDHLCGPPAVQLPDLESLGVEFDPAVQLRGHRLLDHFGFLLCRTQGLRNKYAYGLMR